MGGLLLLYLADNISIQWLKAHVDHKCIQKWCRLLSNGCRQRQKITRKLSHARMIWRQQTRWIYVRVGDETVCRIADEQCAHQWQHHHEQQRRNLQEKTCCILQQVKTFVTIFTELSNPNSPGKKTLRVITEVHKQEREKKVVWLWKKHGPQLR